MLPAVERSADELNEALVRRMDCLISDLLVIDSMTRRGAILPLESRGENLAATRRFTENLFIALQEGRPTIHPWSHRGGRDAVT
jgi:hypothetical protein